MTDTDSAGMDVVRRHRASAHLGGADRADRSFVDSGIVVAHWAGAIDSEFCTPDRGGAPRAWGDQPRTSSVRSLARWTNTDVGDGGRRIRPVIVATLADGSASAMARSGGVRVIMRYLKDAPRFLFFTGKGGVGKTSVACATAVDLATRGRRVLLVSTDPASNLGQVFGITIGNRVTEIPSVPGSGCAGDRSGAGGRRVSGADHRAGEGRSA